MTLLGLSLLCTLAAGPVLDIADLASFRAALPQAVAGTTLRLAPGVYAGGFYAENLHGTAAEPITITAQDPANPPVFEGGSGGHLAGCSYLTLEHLVFRGSTANGLNLDDGGTFGSAHHLTVRSVTITDVGPDGNLDGLKLSGLTDFTVEDCRFERWGTMGSGIDLVGCHRGLITGCTLSHPAARSAGLQIKGGSAEIVVRRCTFEQAGARAINLGGSTGQPWFRPLGATYEARDLVVEGCLFRGSEAHLAFVGVDGATIRYNTFYLPGKWWIRILQETREPGFVPCRNGLLERNLIVFQRAHWAEHGVNIGPGTAPETFVFRDNYWYAADAPERSQTRLPTVETGGVYGQDPGLQDPARGDFTPQAGGPAEGYGQTALPAPVTEP